MRHKHKVHNLILYSIIIIIVMIALNMTRYVNYLVFHSLAELFSISIFIGIFMITWNTRGFTSNDWFVFLSIAYLYISIIDLFHTLAYKGMSIFPQDDANLPTQLWIAARYIEALSLLIMPYFLTKKLKPLWIFSAYSIVFTALMGSIFIWHIFPNCYLPNTGLTQFKIISEYIISVLFLASFYYLVRQRKHMDRKVLVLLGLSIIVKVSSEMVFTLYVSVYDHFNHLGHILKILSSYLVYRAVIAYSLIDPYKMLFLNLKKSEVLHRSLIEDSPIGISLYSQDWKPAIFNEAFREILGYTKAQLQNMSFVKLINDPEMIDILQTTLTAKGVIHDLEINTSRKDETALVLT